MRRLSPLVLLTLSLLAAPAIASNARVDRAECAIWPSSNGNQAQVTIVPLARATYNSLTFSNGVTFASPGPYTGTASNYATWSVYDCAIGQSVYDATCSLVGAYSGASVSIGENTPVALYSGSYTLAIDHALHAKRWTTYTSGAFTVPESHFVAE